MRALRALPNALTVSRLLALPVLAVILLTARGPTDALGAWLFGAIAFTDFLDGRLARLLHAESRVGKVLDPLADRLLVAVGLAGVIALGRILWVGPAVVLLRDAAAVAAVIGLGRRHGLDLRIDLAGKVSSAWVMTATALAILVDARWVDALFWAGVAGSVITFANYARIVARQLGAARSRPADEGSARLG